VQNGILVLLFFFAVSVQAYPLHPNLDTTPSSVCNTQNPDFKEFRYHEQIAYCARNVKSETKKYIYDLYEIPLHCRKHFTIDHFIPLSIGGDNSIENLWPEHKSIKAQRPTLEFDVYQSLQRGMIKQQDAIATIYFEKTTFGRRAFNENCD
jgi:hypothetical protein